MTSDALLRGLALLAILPAGATLYFFVFWRWFDTWRRHRILTYAMMLGTLGGLGAAAYALRDGLLAPRLAFPAWARALGWIVVVASCVFGTVADRQIGLRVRSFAPFFDRRGRIELQTGGVYAIVRHPIYASGIWFQLGVFLAGGHLAVAAACAVFGLGALWFTRQEERRLVTLLEDPAAYERYRARVPGLVPWPRRRVP